MKSKLKKWGTPFVTGLLSLAFLAAGSFKLSGAEEMVTNFNHYGLPIWFMYFVGAAEVAGAIGLWLRVAPVNGWPLRLLATLGLSVMMGGATVTHLINDPVEKAVPAMVLMALTLVLLSSFRKTRLEANSSPSPLSA